jgi:hypothetical protein
MPIDRGEIDAQLRAIGEGERWWEQREFRDLPHVLHPEERIHGIINGKVLGRRRPPLRPISTWLIVVTNQRLLCLRQERFARKQIEVAAGQITRVHQRSRFGGHQITIDTAVHRYRIRIAKEDAFRFSGALAPLLPTEIQPRPEVDYESLAWLPGITTVAAIPGLSGIVSRVAMLSPPDYANRDRDQLARLERTVETLQNDVERLQQQVGFLEDLLHERAGHARLPPDSAD